MIASLNNIWVAVAANKHEEIVGGFPKVGHDLEHPLSTHPGLVQWGDGSRCWPVDAGLALSHPSSGGNGPTPQRGQSHRSWKRHRRWTQVARFQVTADDASNLGRLQGEAHLLYDVYSSFQRNSVVLGADCNSAISRGQSTKIQPMSRVGLDVSMQLLLEVD